MRGFPVLVVAGVTWVAGAAQSPEQAEGPVLGRLAAKVVLVAKDLSLKPVPKRPFQVECVEDSCDFVQAVSTTFQGEISLDLPAGRYRLLSKAPVEFEGERFSWSIDFEIEPGSATNVELSNDNAATEKADDLTASSAPAQPEGTLYRRVRPSVFKVIAESGHGSGFLVDERGLIVTNHHVVKDSQYLAVKIDEKRKYAAVIAAQDGRNDVAVLRVHPAIVEGLMALPLAKDSSGRQPVTVGERVIAVGSPLATEAILTSGLVSKIEEGAIYSDVAINPGSSGGPLFSMLGEVVGINTFGLGAGSGPGVSGIVRIHVAQAVIEEARRTLSQPPPPDIRLPEASDYRFPPERLREVALGAPFSELNYHLDVGKIDVQFITPVVTASLEVRAELEAAEARKKRTKGLSKEYKPGTDFYEWRRYAGDYRPVVVIQAIPEIGLTGGSVFAIMMLGANAQQNYRFKTDFDRMELVRGGTVVEPIYPARSPQVQNVQQGLVTIKDIAYFGAYEYPPEAFRPGAEVILRIWEQSKPDPKARLLSAQLLARIWNDFKPYFEAFERDVAKPATDADP